MSPLRAALADGRGRPLVLAHRGDSSRAPENTLEAAALGHEAGADGWEFDVQLTRDGVPIVFHDPTLGRTTDVARAFPDDPRADLGYLVADFDLAEIRRLDAGSWFVDPAGGPRSAADFGTLGGLGREALERYASGTVLVPTLVEALGLTADLGWMANVELKSDFGDRQAIVGAFLAAVAGLGIDDRLLVSSFDHDLLALVRRASGIATGVLTTTPLHRPAGYVKSLAADTYHLSAAALGAGGADYRRRPGASSLRRRDVADCRREAIPVLVYTVNEKELAGHLAEAGVAGLFSDAPRPLIAGLTPS